MNDDQVTSTSMQRVIMLALTASACGIFLIGQAAAQPVQPNPNSYGAQVTPVAQQYRSGDLGGGFVGFLFRGPQPRGPRYQDRRTPVMQPQVLRQPDMSMPPPPAAMYVNNDSGYI